MLYPQSFVMGNRRTVGSLKIQMSLTRTTRSRSVFQVCAWVYCHIMFRLHSVIKSEIKLSTVQISSSLQWCVFRVGTTLSEGSSFLLSKSPCNWEIKCGSSDSLTQDVWDLVHGHELAELPENNLYHREYNLYLLAEKYDGVLKPESKSQCTVPN